ncbi:aspartate ammonia-lyase [Nocardioides guangzhouensis]|uniref:Aspartate ammonia-lyase n=1 Tax=Nocardioides guangzhouensis TaxID=2497878 RepID=A0A4Q4ZJN9_9ACTN|nr:aspartate ammonia-lyase [Nocardioides guangzhouensis]RYP87736.1 aspartate ammonia-lyase [Nocardioides guangzhouensis]
MTGRVDHDFLGGVEIPADAYWGVHTARALENFPVSGTPISVHRDLVAALGAVKQAAARANRELGLIDEPVAAAIDRAAQDVRDGLLDDQFVVDVVQGGAGTSTNMNANEVVANRALELLGLPAGDHARVHPLDHVNRSQSTNDVYPTAVKIALMQSLDGLAASVARLADAFATRAAEFRGVPKVGRTQLQDAVPMTVGQELGAWATTVREELPRIAEARSLLREINLGATAIGTGITADPRYAAVVCRHLREVTGLPLETAANLVEATSDTGVFVHVSGVLKRTAVKVSKICNDLRLLASGPQAGFRELLLPARQAGSSIMPGKVNPVIPEMVNQVAFWVVGNDVTVTMAAEAGQLQLNAFEPIMCHGLLQGTGWMTRAFDTLRLLCVDGIDVDVDHLTATASRSVGVVTALTPYLGYGTAAEIAKAALAGRGEVRDLVLATGVLDAAELDELLRPEALAGGPTA